jgi:hypothetical protein
VETASLANQPGRDENKSRKSSSEGTGTAGNERNVSSEGQEYGSYKNFLPRQQSIRELPCHIFPVRHPIG